MGGGGAGEVGWGRGRRLGGGGVWSDAGVRLKSRAEKDDNREPKRLPTFARLKMGIFFPIAAGAIFSPPPLNLIVVTFVLAGPKPPS